MCRVTQRYKKHIWTKALARLGQVSDKVFHDITQKGSIPFQGQNNNLLPITRWSSFCRNKR